MRKPLVLAVVLIASTVLAVNGSSPALATAEWEPLGQVISGDADYLEAGQPVLSGDGRTLAIPAIYSSAATGHVDVYSLVNGQWVRKGLRLVGSDSMDQFGSDVALDEDGNVLAIGANLADGLGNATNAAGEVKVYDWVNGAWTQRGSTIDGDSTGNSLGDRVHLDATGQRFWPVPRTTTTSDRTEARFSSSTGSTTTGFRSATHPRVPWTVTRTDRRSI